GQVAVDLQAEFAGGYHDQGPWNSVERAIRACGGDSLQQRHAEGEGLAHPSAGLADQVVAGEGERQRELLDGEGMLNAFFAERPDYFFADTKVGKGGFACGSVRCDEWSHALSTYAFRVRIRLVNRCGHA